MEPLKFAVQKAANATGRRMGVDVILPAQHVGDGAKVNMLDTGARGLNTLLWTGHGLVHTWYATAINSLSGAEPVPQKSAFGRSQTRLDSLSP